MLRSTSHQIKPNCLIEKIMNLFDTFLEKWHQCKEARYKVMLLSPSRPALFSDSLLAKLVTVIEAEKLDFSDRYISQIASFFTRRKIQQEIETEAAATPLLITGLEPFYSKWPINERFAFLRYALRMETAQGVVLLLYCQEELTEIKAVAENNRGMIWTP